MRVMRRIVARGNNDLTATTRGEAPAPRGKTQIAGLEDVKLAASAIVEAFKQEITADSMAVAVNMLRVALSKPSPVPVVALSTHHNLKNVVVPYLVNLLRAYLEDSCRHQRASLTRTAENEHVSVDAGKEFVRATSDPGSAARGLGVSPGALKSGSSNPALLGHVRLSVAVDAMWALTNLATGESATQDILINLGVVDLCMRYVDVIPHPVLVETAVWVLGNIAGDGAAHREVVMQAGGLQCLAIRCACELGRLGYFPFGVRNGDWSKSGAVAAKEGKACHEGAPAATEVNAKGNVEGKGPVLGHTSAVLRITTWALGNLCEGAGVEVGGGRKRATPLLQLLAVLNVCLDVPDSEVLAHSCWALSHICDGPPLAIHAVLSRLRASIPPFPVQAAMHGQPHAGSAATVTDVSYLGDDATQARVLQAYDESGGTSLNEGCGLSTVAVPHASAHDLQSIASIAPADPCVLGLWERDEYGPAGDVEVGRQSPPSAAMRSLWQVWWNAQAYPHAYSPKDGAPDSTASMPKETDVMHACLPSTAAKLLRLLRHGITAVAKPALRSIGNIVCAEMDPTLSVPADEPAVDSLWRIALKMTETHGSDSLASVALQEGWNTPRQVWQAALQFAAGAAAASRLYGSSGLGEPANAKPRVIVSVSELVRLFFEASAGNPIAKGELMIALTEMGGSALAAARAEQSAKAIPAAGGQPVRNTPIALTAAPVRLPVALSRVESDFTQGIVDLGAVGLLRIVLEAPSSSSEMLKEACWTLSNVAAGSVGQIQSILDSGVLPCVVKVCGDPGAPPGVRTEACWVVLNASACGSEKQIEVLVRAGAVRALCTVLTDPHMAGLAVDGLEKILQVCERLASTAAALITRQRAAKLLAAIDASGSAGLGKAMRAAGGEGSVSASNPVPSILASFLSEVDAHSAMVGAGGTAAGSCVGVASLMPPPGLDLPPADPPTGRAIEDLMLADAKALLDTFRIDFAGRQAATAAEAKQATGIKPNTSDKSNITVGTGAAADRESAVRRANKLWMENFVTCRLCSRTWPRATGSTRFCEECRCEVCAVCNCEVYHLSYQLEQLGLEEEQASKGKKSGKSKGKEKKKEKSKEKGKNAKTESAAAAAASPAKADAANPAGHVSVPASPSPTSSSSSDVDIRTVVHPLSAPFSSAATGLAGSLGESQSSSLNSRGGTPAPTKSDAVGGKRTEKEQEKVLAQVALPAQIDPSHDSNEREWIDVDRGTSSGTGARLLSAAASTSSGSGTLVGKAGKGAKVALSSAPQTHVQQQPQPQNASVRKTSVSLLTSSSLPEKTAQLGSNVSVILKVPVPGTVFGKGVGTVPVPRHTPSAVALPVPVGQAHGAAAPAADRTQQVLTPINNSKTTGIVSGAGGSSSSMSLQQQQQLKQQQQEGPGWNGWSKSTGPGAGAGTRKSEKNSSMAQSSIMAAPGLASGKQGHPAVVPSSVPPTSLGAGGAQLSAQIRPPVQHGQGHGLAWPGSMDVSSDMNKGREFVLSALPDAFPRGSSHAPVPILPTLFGGYAQGSGQGTAMDMTMGIGMDDPHSGVGHSNGNETLASIRKVSYSSAVSGRSAGTGGGHHSAPGSGSGAASAGQGSAQGSPYYTGHGLLPPEGVAIATSLTNDPMMLNGGLDFQGMGMIMGGGQLPSPGEGSPGANFHGPYSSSNGLPIAALYAAFNAALQASGSAPSSAGSDIRSFWDGVGAAGVGDGGMDQQQQQGSNVGNTGIGMPIGRRARTLSMPAGTALTPFIASAGMPGTGSTHMGGRAPLTLASFLTKPIPGGSGSPPTPAPHVGAGTVQVEDGGGRGAPYLSVAANEFRPRMALGGALGGNGVPHGGVGSMHHPPGNEAGDLTSRSGSTIPPLPHPLGGQVQAGAHVPSSVPAMSSLYPQNASQHAPGMVTHTPMGMGIGFGLGTGGGGLAGLSGLVYGSSHPGLMAQLNTAVATSNNNLPLNMGMGMGMLSQSQLPSIGNAPFGGGLSMAGIKLQEQYQPHVQQRHVHGYGHTQSMGMAMAGPFGIGLSVPSHVQAPPSCTVTAESDASGTRPVATIAGSSLDAAADREDADLLKSVMMALSSSE